MTREYDIQAVVASNVRAARARRGWTQREMAAEAGVGLNTLARIESEASYPSIWTVQLIADALEVSISELMEDGPGDA